MAAYKSLKQQLIPKEANEVLSALKTHKQNVKRYLSHLKHRPKKQTKLIARTQERLDVIGDLIADLS